MPKILIPHSMKLEGTEKHAVVWTEFIRGDYENNQKLSKVKANVKSGPFLGICRSTVQDSCDAQCRPTAKERTGRLLSRRKTAAG